MPRPPRQGRARGAAGCGLGRGPARHHRGDGGRSAEEGRSDARDAGRRRYGGYGRNGRNGFLSFTFRTTSNEGPLRSGPFFAAAQFAAARKRSVAPPLNVSTSPRKLQVVT